MDLYCKLFVDSDLPPNQLLQRMADWTGGHVSRKTVATAWGELDAEDNEQYDETLRSDEQDGFLHFRYYFDVDPAPTVDEGDYIKGVGGLLLQLWSNGMKAVAACDFEELLPNCGGYNSARKEG